ncbi:MAG: hypothetical protein JW966_09355 [Anaerolineae bacterium]|nr:hypothetical protein [Anaerolineae bacterium]
MHLSQDEALRFYTIWFPLLYYVNQQQELIPEFPSEYGDASVEPQNAVTLREALWADDSLREGFIAENPANLSADDLALVDSWQHRVTGDFYIFRYLKKHTVLLSSESPMRAFGVHGLVSPIEEIIGPYLPILIKTVLLPFEDRIIYDSLFSSYSIHFGGGYRSSLKDGYNRIQEREGLITTLPPYAERSDPAAEKKHVQEKNKKLLTAFQKELGKAGLSPKMMEEHTAAIAAFAENFLLAQTPPAYLLDTNRAHVEAYMKATSSKANLVSFKRFARFLRDTDRVYYEDAEELLDFLKRQ